MMRALPVLAIQFLGFASKAAQASGANVIPPPATITPAPALHKRFDNDFVGYVLFDDGDSESTTNDEPCSKDSNLTHISSKHFDMQWLLHVHVHAGLCWLRQQSGGSWYRLRWQYYCLYRRKHCDMVRVQPQSSLKHQLTTIQFHGLRHGLCILFP
jgi:hypothetical protein